MSAYSVTAFLPGPRYTYTDYKLDDTRPSSEASNHLDDCLKRTGRQSTKLDYLGRRCEDNLDTCKTFYRHARELKSFLSY